MSGVEGARSAPRAVFQQRKGSIPGRRELINGQAQVADIVQALRAARRLASALHSGGNQRHQYSDDRNNDEQLDQREPAPSTRVYRCAMRSHWESSQIKDEGACEGQ